MSNAKQRVVWVVDDSPLDAARARASLSRTYAVLRFADGADALEKLNSGEERPDVIVLDWLMPNVSGLEACRYIRSRRELDDIGVLVITAHGESTLLIEALQAGANDFLAKPWADEELLARVASLVRTKTSIERAEEAEAEVRRMLDEAPDPLIAINEKWTFTYANLEAERAFGRLSTSLIGRSAAEILPGLSTSALQQAEPGILGDVEINGRIFEPSVRHHMGKHVGGGRTISLRDVTERRAAEQRRLDFYSMVAHDLRSPMQAILLRTELLLRGRRGELPIPVTADLGRIQDHVNSLVRMLNDFLDLARLEATNYKLEIEELDIGALMRASIEDLRPLADAAGLAMAVDIHPVLPRTLGDSRLLSQVFVNLLGNAIKFTRAGGTVTVRIAPESSHVIISVKDEGPGIEPERQAVLFDRYVRAASDKPGTGLGLTIVKEIVTAHAGTFGVKSKVGEGSEFWVSLKTDGTNGLKDR
jgi:two-component system phosphate regulon sensor histidine kinase PhoR